MSENNRILWVIGLGIAVLFLAVGCVTAPVKGGGGQAPQWVTDKDAVYPPEEFLAEVGQGDNLNDAKSKAAGAIAQIFQTRVKVDSQIRTRYTEMTGEGGASLGMLTRTDYDQTIGQSAEQSLSNLRYGESWTDEMGQVYAVAYLDRAETGNLYRQRIVENDDRVSELMDRARRQDEPLRRFAFLDAALVVGEANNVLIEQLEIINMPMARSVMHPYELGELRAARADQGTALKMRVEVAGETDGRIEAVLSDWVTGRGFSVSSGGDMFLSAVVSVAPLELDNGYENLSWELNISLLDSLGYPAVSLPGQSRSTGISATAAEARAYQDMTEMIQKDFDREFTKYLTSFLEK
ncbi:MAG: LPP20 family lipoprotein [Spirochaetaceae bacterium]|nr:LPP20 family lipoprotein [Spirochaetaceae bacterium]